MSSSTVNVRQAANYYPATATGTVVGVPCSVHGYIVTVAMSAAATTVYDGTSATGNVLFVIPASTAVGSYPLPGGVQARIGLHAVFAGTGTVNFIAQP